MNDDLNTADALGVIFEYARDMNTALMVKRPLQGGVGKRACPSSRR